MCQMEDMQLWLEQRAPEWSLVGVSSIVWMINIVSLGTWTSLHLGQMLYVIGWENIALHCFP